MSVIVSIDDSPKPEPPRPREGVFVVLHSDGWVEVFAEKHVDVAIVNRLHATDVSPEFATDLDQYTGLSAPRCYRKLYWPNKLRATGQIVKQTFEQEGIRLQNVKTLRKIRAAVEPLTRGRK